MTIKMITTTNKGQVLNNNILVIFNFSHDELTTFDKQRQVYNKGYLTVIVAIIFVLVLIVVIIIVVIVVIVIVAIIVVIVVLIVVIVVLIVVSYPETDN